MQAMYRFAQRRDVDTRSEQLYESMSRGLRCLKDIHVAQEHGESRSKSVALRFVYGTWSELSLAAGVNRLLFRELSETSLGDGQAAVTSRDVDSRSISCTFQLCYQLYKTEGRSVA